MEGDWRAILARAGIAVHPACDTLPMLSDKELDGLAGSIERNGLRVMLELWRPQDSDPWQLASGRNRCAAMARLEGGEEMILGAIGCAIQRTGGDPFALVADLDHRRRHMTPDQRRAAIAALLKADPSRSDRSVAKEAGASPTYVGTVRKTEEQAGQLSTVDSRRGDDGRTRSQPAPRQPPTEPKPYPHDPPGVARMMPPVRPEMAEEEAARLSQPAQEERMHALPNDPDGDAVGGLVAWLEARRLAIPRLPQHKRCELALKVIVALHVSVEGLVEHVGGGADEP